MRLSQLSLIKYGKFSDEVLAFPAAAHDFHVIVGPNEAGKSTVRTAVSELLFGMKLQTPLDFLHNTPELRLGGVIEGRLGRTEFHRARGRSSLRSPADDKLPEDHLAAWLDGATREFFEQMFGLDHDRLLEGGKSLLNASDKLGQVLFESAAGVGSLGPVREALEGRATELWAPRRANCEQAVAEAALTQASTDLKTVQVRTRDWAEQKEALAAITTQIDEARAAQARLETDRARLERIRRLAPFMQELAAKEEALAAMVLAGPVIELPDTATDELLTARSQIAVAQSLLAERRADWQARQQARAALQANDAVLALASDIEALDRLRGACINHPRDLPLRQAEADRHLAAAFDAASQLAWPTEEATLRATLPKALALKTVTQLLREHGALQQAALSTAEAHAEKTRELSELSAERQHRAVAELPAALRVALAAAQAAQASAPREQALQTELRLAEQAVQDALQRLGRWRQPVAVLQGLDLPSLARLAALQKEEAEGLNAAAAARQALAQADDEVARLSLQLRHLAEGNRVVTATEVQAARAHRDGFWSAIKTGSTPLMEGAPALDGALRLADELVDTQRDTAQAAASLQALRQQLEAAEAEQRRKQAALTEREAACMQFASTWAQQAHDAGLPGMPLADVAAWLTQREAALTAQGQLDRLQAEHAGLQSSSERARVALAQALLLWADVPTSPGQQGTPRAPRAAAPPAMPLFAGLDAEHADEHATEQEAVPLPVLLAQAEALLQANERALARQASLAERLQAAERAVAAAQARVETAQAALDAWTAQWREALGAARLESVVSTLAAAEGAVELVQLISAELAATQAPRDRLAAMQADLAALDQQARALAHALGAALQPTPAADEDGLALARRLAALAARERDAALAVQRADEALAQAQTKVAEAESALLAAQARVRPLLQQLGVDDIDAALPAAQRSDARRALLRDAEKARDTLLRDGDGLSLAALAQELAEVDITQVPARLAQVQLDHGSLADELTRLRDQHSEARRRFEAVAGQADAALAEARRQEALSALGEVAEQYLETATASRLLKWAIDRYREQKQGPMLKRASEIFAGLTLGDFSRLTVDAEAQPPRLYARRSSGPSVEVIGLSEGTRDQLYLALRIAALELQLQSKGALPFVADDLFINFDDQRARAGLEALRDLSTRTQVIFLTHHDHLLPMVREVMGEGVNVLPLQRTAVTG